MELIGFLSSCYIYALNAYFVKVIKQRVRTLVFQNFSEFLMPKNNDLTPSVTSAIISFKFYFFFL